MSKLQVNSIEPTGLIQTKRSSSATGVSLIIDQGRKINSARDYGTINPVNLNFSPEKSCKESKFEIYKILYPPEAKYKRCSHQNGYVVNRHLLTSKEYIDLLAQPKKYSKQRHPCWVKKSIPASSLRIKALAQPKSCHVLNTFESHLNSLSIAQIEKFLSHLFKTDYATPAETVRDMKQSLRQSRCRIERQRKEIRKLYKKLSEAKCEEITKQIIKQCSPYIRNSRQQGLSKDAELHSKAILSEMCQLMKQNVPQRNSDDLVDRVFVSIADDVASWFETNALNVDETCLKPLSNPCENERLKGCVEIEDYYPHVVEKKDERSTEEQQRDSLRKSLEKGAMDAVEVSVISSPSKMSFLRRSQFVINENECQELLAKIRKSYEEDSSELSGDSIQLSGIGKFREVDGTKKPLKKKSADAKKSAAGNKRADAKKHAAAKKQAAIQGRLADCLGDVDKKPQWDITYIARG